MSINSVSYAPGSTQSYLSQSNNDKDFFGKNGFSIGTVIDAINPLKNLPVVSDIYDKITNSEPSAPASKLAGGALYGGVFGFVTSLFDSLVGEVSGENLAGHVLSLLENNTPAANAADKYAAAQELSHDDEVKNASSQRTEHFNVLSISI